MWRGDGETGEMGDDGEMLEEIRRDHPGVEPET